MSANPPTRSTANAERIPSGQTAHLLPCGHSAAILSENRLEWALTDYGGYFWPAWVLAGWGVGLVLHAYETFLHRPVSEAEAPGYHAIVRELATAARQPMPRLYVSPTAQPRARNGGRRTAHVAG